MRVGEKTQGISGAAAPSFWQQGNRQEVIDYCAQDTRLTLSLAQAAQEKGCLNRLDIPEGWLTVAQARLIPLSDTSRMSNSISRAEFDGWLEI